MNCHQLPAAQAEDSHGRRLVTLVDKRGRGGGGAGRLGQVEQGGGRLLWLLQLKVTVGLHLARFVLEVVGADQLVQEVNGRALRFRILHPEVSQVGAGVTGETLASLEPGATQLTDYVLVGVHLQRCVAMGKKEDQKV